MKTEDIKNSIFLLNTDLHCHEGTVTRVNDSSDSFWVKDAQGKETNVRVGGPTSHFLPGHAVKVVTATGEDYFVYSENFTTGKIVTHIEMDDSPVQRFVNWPAPLVGFVFLLSGYLLPTAILFIPLANLLSGGFLALTALATVGKVRKAFLFNVVGWGLAAASAAIGVQMFKNAGMWLIIVPPLVGLTTAFGLISRQMVKDWKDVRARVFAVWNGKGQVA